MISTVSVSVSLPVVKHLSLSEQHLSSQYCHKTFTAVLHASSIETGYILLLYVCAHVSQLVNDTFANL